jgi:hypothetical protein
MNKITKSEHLQIFEILKFVIGARAKDQIKPIFTYAYCQDNVLICTDTRRLHFCNISDFPGKWENGFYKISENGKEVILIKSDYDDVFPDYKKVIPEKKENGILIKQIKNLKNVNGMIAGKQFAKIFRILSDKFTLNIQFLMDVLKYDNFIMYSNKDSFAPVLFESENNKKAIIMPIQIKD